ncbi:MAG: hypothetical protein ABI813_02100 [Bacteroidota bacterium]
MQKLAQVRIKDVRLQLKSDSVGKSISRMFIEGLKSLLHDCKTTMISDAGQHYPGPNPMHEFDEEKRRKRKKKKRIQL